MTQHARTVSSRTRQLVSERSLASIATSDAAANTPSPMTVNRAVEKDPTRIGLLEFLFGLSHVSQCYCIASHLFHRVWLTFRVVLTLCRTVKRCTSRCPCSRSC